MISFRPTEEEKQFVTVARDFADEIRAAARDCEEAGQTSDVIARKAEELGLTVMELPEAADGLELPLASQVQILEALCFGDLAVVQGFPGTADADSLVRTADAAGLTAQVAEMAGVPTAFVDAAQGDLLPNETLKLEAGDAAGTYRLSGTSRPVRGAKQAKRLYVAVQDASGQPIVLRLDAETGGDASEPASDADTAPWRVDVGDVRLGLLTAGIGRLIFDGTEVAETAVVATGKAATAWLTAARARIAVLQAARAVGTMQAALEYATMYTAGRKAFGQEIAKFQGVSFTVADMAMETAAARNLTWCAAAQLDSGDSAGVQSARAALALANRSLRYVTDNGVQLLGGHGFVQDYPVEKWMRDGQAQAVLYGRETQHLIEYGEALLAAGGEPA